MSVQREKAVTVYITQEVPGRDLSDALVFGDLDILLPAKEQISLSAMPTVRRMQRKLAKFERFAIGNAAFQLISALRFFRFGFSV
mgnify:CR=1 FL=1